MRLFFALWPDDRVRDELAAIGHACSERYRGRVVPARNLHITLAFLGEVDPNRLDALCDIGAALHAPSFSLVFDRVGCFRRSGIVYAGVSSVPAPLVDLDGQVRPALDEAGFRTEARRLVPHVTLIRDARMGLAIEPQCARVMWQVRHIVLVESTRGMNGQVYQPVRRFMLAP